MRREPHCVVGLLGCLALLLGAPAAASTGGTDDQDPQPRVSALSSSPDFFIGRPRASLGLRGNWFLASAKSDIFEFVTEHLTIERSSFNTPTFGAEIGVNLTSRFDVVVGFDIGRSATPSEYRAFVDNQNLPIEQTTKLKQSNLFGTLRYALTRKGQSISRLAWIPQTITPYVGGGGGVVHYDFLQTGDFVDFQTNRVFPDYFRSSGWTSSGHVLAGADVQVYKHMYMSFEGKYVWSSATLQQKFVGFEPIDLSGARFGAGIHLVF